MSLYTKLYRRRRYVYYLLISFLFFGILFFSNQSFYTDLLIDSAQGDSKYAININNYVEPPSCHDCPGENGKAVFLSVRI